MSQLLEKEKVEELAEPFRCLCCRVILGFTNGKLLKIAGVFINKSTPLACANCKTVRIWRVVS